MINRFTISAAIFLIPACIIAANAKVVPPATKYSALAHTVETKAVEKNTYISVFFFGFVTFSYILPTIALVLLSRHRQQ